jgi:hypothetical protein
MSEIIPIGVISGKIKLIRNHKVILDRDLTQLYGVTTKRLNEQVRRNRDRFPADFLIELTVNEKEEVVAKCDHLESMKFSPVLPLAYTEHGALMAASVLKTQRAVEVSIFVVRAFVQLRQMLATHKDLKRKIEAMEAKYDENFQIVFAAIKQLLAEDEKPKRKIGF